MNLEQAKKYLKDGYELAGFDVISEEANGDTLLRYPEAGLHDITLKITPEDAQEYAELVEAREEFISLACGFANANFREHLLQALSPHIDERDLQDFFFKGQDNSQIYLEIDAASLVFVNYFRFEPDYVKLCLDRLLALPEKYRHASQTHPLDIRSFFARPLTLRVFNIGATSPSEALILSNRLIENSLFQLAYRYQVPLILAQSWTVSRYERRRLLRRDDPEQDYELVPNVAYRQDLVRLYQAGLASSIPSHQFLSFYQILEFFFYEVEHASAYQPLRDFISSADFQADDADLTRLIYIIEGTKAHQSTVDLLAQLMRQHVGSAAIRGFLESQGTGAEESLLALARRLVGLRDAIVNAGENLLPMPVDSHNVSRDVPLVRFLAEQVILVMKAE